MLIQKPRRADVSPATRSIISRAALLVKVSPQISHGATPCSTSHATRCVITRVFPLPGPATISSGPSTVVTASRCAGLSGASKGCSPGMLGV